MKIEFEKGGLKFTGEPINIYEEHNRTPLGNTTIELECPNCGGHPNKDDIDLVNYQYTCPFCGTVVQLPRPENKSNNVNIKNTYYINTTPREEVETDEYGVPRRPLEERKLNMKIWLGFVIAFVAFIALIFGYTAMDNLNYSSNYEKTVEQDLNPFETQDIVVYFEGQSGKGTYRLDISPKLDGLEYEVDSSAEQGSLSNGDTVTFKITNADAFKGRYNFTKIEGTATANFDNNIIFEPELMEP